MDQKRPTAAAGRPPRDPRDFQIAALTALLTYGLFVLDFAVSPFQIGVTVGTALLAQFAATRLWRLPRFDPKSALISSLSLCLLLRTPSLGLAAAAATIAILSKFLFRLDGRHIFNPTALALVAVIAFTDAGWVSPGQWGSATFFGFAIVCAGSLVVRRAAVADMSLTFLAAYLALVFGRALWLGDSLAIPLHHVQSGALLLFTFFMISDPKTSPVSAKGRAAFGALVAAGAGFVHFVLFEPNGFLWALVTLAPAVPLLNRLLPHPSTDHRKERPMKRTLIRTAAAAAIALLLPLSDAAAFCGFYVAKADADLFNEASQVVLVRDGDRTVVTMANDYQGDLTEFAMVVPVPTFLEREQIHVTEMKYLDHLDAYTAPRLVEYFDEDPCRTWGRISALKSLGYANDAMSAPTAELEEAAELGVTIEATYTVGEYDILILSAEESDGLVTWLTQNDYRLPDGAAPVLGSYLKQDMRFFVAKVNLAKQAEAGFTYLRPLQIAYESPKFMLPIRLGTLNARGTQDLLVYALTKTGRVETTNYRTVKLPSGSEIPPFVKNEFDDFYRDMFAEQVRRENGRAVFLEYAWDMAWCDPCAADPMSRDELRELGVFWLDGGGDTMGPPTRRPGSKSAAQNVNVTRLHVRYDAETFPDDLRFQETGDRSNYQGRYVMRHPWDGTSQCEAARDYRRQLRDRQEREVQTLAHLTGWDVNEIREQMRFAVVDPENDPAIESAGSPWWSKIWSR